MNIGYDLWWLEEVREHYKLFKYLSSAFFFVLNLQILFAFTIGSEECFEGIPMNSLLIYYIIAGTFVSLLWYMGTDFNEKCLWVAFLNSEFLNICFYLSSYTILIEQKLILCMGSTVHLLVLQMGFIKNLKFAFIMLVKHVFI